MQHAETVHVYPRQTPVANSKSEVVNVLVKRRHIAVSV